ncbi:MarR family winged helix-turn-helix transcriptional regulator [Pseudoalteromonas denitrificans]|uniref:DNA-binding transcriptional regulator, MarR family n=1 Tax=Pseudoalteromonas denitrificans DSM 6059 TaxID=1123010 RepID=A0A1I1FLF8_9GAMM|nr:MarR family transcriptional regulator [Pseudoalteromonas denitrificans]SFC00111.1 DNA-binding transcriptional regulator, MarR family [Pseudoalteromonas denitrificans DSM 6059]
MTTKKTINLSDFLPYRLANLANNVSEAFSEVYCDEFDLSIPQWRILVNLFEHGLVTAKDLGDLAAMDKSTVSRAVKIMLVRGDLIKIVNEKDKRAYYLQLTEQGKDLYYAIAPKALDWESDLLSVLDVNEQKNLMLIIDKLDKKIAFK